VKQTVASEFDSAQADFNASFNGELPAHSGQHEDLFPAPQYRHPKKNWRLKRSATPQWYKQRNGVRAKAQSGAARVARFRPPRPVA
jgi:sec-independent protein translocase protein TatB